MFLDISVLMINHNVIIFKEFRSHPVCLLCGYAGGTRFLFVIQKGGITLNLLVKGIAGVPGSSNCYYPALHNRYSNAHNAGICLESGDEYTGLGAAQQAYSDMYGTMDNTIALGLRWLLIRVWSVLFFRLCLSVMYSVWTSDKESEQLNNEDSSHANEAKPISWWLKIHDIWKNSRSCPALLEHRFRYIPYLAWQQINRLK